MSKLTDAQIIEIIRLHGLYSSKSIKDHFNRSQSSIVRIGRGHSFIRLHGIHHTRANFTRLHKEDLPKSYKWIEP
jgi:hypothetical protein